MFFGYAWLHPSLQGGGAAAFVFFLVVANAMVLGYVVFLTKYFWTVDTVRWEQGGWRPRNVRRRRVRPDDDDEEE